MPATIKCKKCGAEIKFFKMESGKAMPVDAKPKKVITEDGKVIDGYTPHWATCPNADVFRKQK